jgi:putative DNA primase/helicase
MTDRAHDLETRVRDLSQPEYALARKEIAAEFDVRAVDLDEIFKQTHPKRATPEQPKQEALWPDPVDGNVLLNGLLRSLETFVVAERSALVAVAFWVVHAHAHEAFNVSPILLISSPVKGCGKSTLLDILEILAPRSLVSANTSAAALYRSTESRPTILVDEADLYFSDDRSIVSFFNAGHRRGVPFRRCEGEDNHVVAFDSWAPKAIAQIGMPRWPTVIDRSITIQLRRKFRHEQAQKFRKSRCYPDLEDMRPMAARWAEDHLDVLKDAEPPMPSSLDNRAEDNWEPLFAIAHAVGGDWPAKLEKSVRDLHQEDDDRRIELLRDLRTIFHESDSDFMATQEIVTALHMLTERPYMTINRGKEINANWLAKQLKPFELNSQQVRPSNGHGAKVRGYYAAPIEKVCARYLGLTEASEASEADASDASDASIKPSETEIHPEDDEEIPF